MFLIIWVGRVTKGVHIIKMGNLNKDLLYALFKFRKAAAQISYDSDLRMNEMMALVIVDSHCAENEKSLLASDVGETLSISHSAVSQMLTSLEKKGYVYRNISEADKRQYRFTLTEKGRNVTYVTKNQIDKTINDVIIRFGEARIITFTQMLNDFACILSQIQDNSKNEI